MSQLSQTANALWPDPRLAYTAAVLLVVSAVRYGWEVQRGPPSLTAPVDDGPGLLVESLLLKEECDARGRSLWVGEHIDNNRASEVEPILIVVLGVMVGGMIVAMYLSIFDMINAVK